MDRILHPGRLSRAALPNIGQFTYNPVQTEILIGKMPSLGVSGGSALPSVGFDHPAPQIPRLGRAAVAGNRLQSKSNTGIGVKHEIGFTQSTELTLAMDYSDGKVRLPWSLRDRWDRNIGAIGIDALLGQVAAEAIANTDDADFVSTIWVGASWTTRYTSGSVAKWNNYASNPANQIRAARRAVKKQCGQNPNHLILPQEAADALCEHPKLRLRLAGGQGGPVDQLIKYADLARALELDKVTVIDRVSNTASDLVEANISLDYTISDGALLFVDRGPDVTSGTAAIRAFYNPAGQQGVMVDTGSNNEDRYDYWTLARHAGYNIVDARGGAFFDDIL